MATPRKSGDERMVSRTYRAAIRLGEDFITLEETIALPLDASDEEVAQAVELGWRIYRAQREAAEAQVADIRGTIGAPAPITVRDPDSPASDKQRNYIATLQDQMSWTSEQIAAYAEDQRIDLVTLTKGQASQFIDGLKKLAEERAPYADGARGKPPAPRAEAPASPGDAPVNEKQIHAMERLAQQQGLDLDMEARRRFGVAAHGLTFEQASALLRELQRPATRRAVNETAL
ncbi:MAG TPA: hypothetical protein VF897_13495 [Roseiflexaceae bacterium]